MIDDWFLVPDGWPRGSLRRWLAALGTVAVLLVVLYFLFSALGL